MADAIRQLKEQIFRDYEVVVIDDASTDSSIDLLRAAIDGDHRFRIIESSVSRGVAAARNNAIGECRGEYVWFADCDDYWAPDLLEQAYRRITEADADLCIFRARRVDAARREIRTIPYQYSPSSIAARELVSRFLSGVVHGFLWDKMIRRELLRPAQFPEIRAFSDSGGMIDILCRVRSAVFCDRYLYEYVRREGSISTRGRQDLDNLLQLSEIIKAALERYSLAEDLKGPYSRYHARMLAGSVKLALRSDVSSEVAAEQLATSRRALKELQLSWDVRSGRSVLRSAELWLLKSFPGTYSALYRRYRRFFGNR